MRSPGTPPPPPTPYTLPPTLYFLHPTPNPTLYFLHPAPNPTPCSLHPAPYTLHPTSYTLHPTPHPTSYTLHPTPHPTSYTAHQMPYATPLSSEFGTHKTVKAGFWSWLSGESPHTLSVGPSSSSSSSSSLSSLELSDLKVYEPSMRVLLGTAAHFCVVVFQRLKMLRSEAALHGVGCGMSVCSCVSLCVYVSLRSFL